MFVSGDLRIHITRSREQGVDMFVSSNIYINKKIKIAYGLPTLT